jgi:1-deoxy-D-xylulose-5-phosphate synthase
MTSASFAQRYSSRQALRDPGVKLPFMRGATERYPLLDRLRLPTDVCHLGVSQLPALATELRDFLRSGMATRPDRLPAALTNVELAIALHYVFDASSDRIVWDDSREAWPYQVLSSVGGRWHGNRPARDYQAAPRGHASTTIGAALGLAIGAARLGEQRRVVAVVTDSALTGGTTFEALNHAGSLPADLLVILNATGSPLSGNSSTLTNHLARILSGPVYAQLRHHGKKVLRQMPTMRELARRSEQHLKGMVLPGTIFEELGFNYIGPVDGHNVGALAGTLRNLKRLRGPQFLHVVTGQEKSAPAAAASRPRAGWQACAPDFADSFSEVFGEWLCDVATADPAIIVVTADRQASPGLVSFSQRFPERWFDVSVAQQHAVTFAAGLAAAGLRPVVAISASCLQRTYDQLIHDVALQRLPVVFAVDHAGLVGGDDATQHGSHDLSYLRCVPNFTIMTPADEGECRQMLSTARALDGPTAVRFPCGQGPRVPVAASMSVLPMGRAQLRREGRSGVALLVFGALLDAAASAAERLDATLVNMRFAKPIDHELVLALSASHRALVTIEENVVAGGAGSGVAELLASHGGRIPLLQLGIPDRFMKRGTRADCLAAARLDTAGLCDRIERWLMPQSPERLRVAG